MKQLTATKVSDGWIVTIRQVFHVKDEKEVYRFMHYHSLEKDETLSNETTIQAEG